MSLTYASWVSSIANLCQIPTSDAYFQTVIPNVIDDAEQRMYRELDLLNTVTRYSGTSLTAGSRTFNYPATIPTGLGTSSFVVTQQLNVVTPISAPSADNGGTRNPLTPASKEMLDALWPSVTGSAVPTYFAPVTQGQVIVGPWPDQSYNVEIVGTFRPIPMSVGNQTTILSNSFPDLWMAATMVFMAGYMKNYGAGADDPNMGVTWETHYQKLMGSAQIEEQRKKFSSEAWSDKLPAAAGMPRV